jgi:hypothetical protein
MAKIAGSGSISQRHGSADPDPDPPQNVMDPQHFPQHIKKPETETEILPCGMSHHPPQLAY